MSLYLDTRGLVTAAVGVCDRCKRKYPLAYQQSDGQTPALKVCSRECADLNDPYRLPARQTENITLQYPRPDEILE